MWIHSDISKEGFEGHVINSCLAPYCPAWISGFHPLETVSVPWENVKVVIEIQSLCHTCWWRDSGVVKHVKLEALRFPVVQSLSILPILMNSISQECLEGIPSNLMRLVTWSQAWTSEILGGQRSKGKVTWTLQNKFLDISQKFKC